MRRPCGVSQMAMAWGALSDEGWVGLSGLLRATDYFERVFIDTGVDLRSA